MKPFVLQIITELSRLPPLPPPPTHTPSLLRRRYALFQPAIFLACSYLPDDSQILTAGTNYKLSYWDASDGAAIRVIDGAKVSMALIFLYFSTLL